MTNFYLGCAVWSYKEWVGNLYPPKSRAADFLNLYSQRFTTVEGNTTFYAVPSKEVIAKWAAQTPVGFKFCPKLNRQITHQGLLSPRTQDAMAFLARMSGLGVRLGTTFIQLPPNYSPQNLNDLTEFLGVCSQSNLPLALEVRHLDWFEPENSDRLNYLLNRLNISRVLLDTRPIYNCPDNPQLNSPRKKPKLPLQETITSDVIFIRFISHPNLQHNQSYLEKWAVNLNSWLRQGKIVYFFVHCPQEIHSPQTAKYFQSLLIDKGCNIPSLPWNSIDPEPQQLNLF